MRTGFWRPKEDYERRIVEALRGKVKRGDVVVISEKALSTVLGNIVDEGRVKAGRLARLLAQYWMHHVWGYILGPLCHLRNKMIRHFRDYPVEEGGAHKQVVLRYGGFLQALMNGSEGGIDGSNLPYAYVSLPLNDSCHVAEKLRDSIRKDLGKNVTVMIVDTDKTYSWRNFHFTPRPNPIGGIRSAGGLIAYVVGRSLKLKRRATPLAVVGNEMSVEVALDMAELASHARGSGAGRTIHEMAESFNVSLTGVSWKMLEGVTHKPVVILRPMYLDA